MSIKDSVKKCIGIYHEELDSEITRLEKVAKTELKRLGISESKINGNDSLIEEAVIDFVCKTLASDAKEREWWDRSWRISSTALKDSTNYLETKHGEDKHV